MTVNSRVIQTFLQWAPDATDVPLMNGLRVQILPTVEDLPKARKNQFAAFLAAESLLVVWDDEPNEIFARATAIEDELLELVWRTGEPVDVEEENEKKKGPAVVEVEIDDESGQPKPENRPTHIMNGVLVGCTLCIITVMLGAGFREVVIQIMVDKGYARLAFLALTPVQIFFTLVCGPKREESDLCTDFHQVLRTGHRRLHCAMHRPHPPNDNELAILLRSPSSTTRRRTPAYYHPMSRIQRRSCLCHCPNRQVDQAGHVHVRIARWLCKYAHQRRWTTAYR